MNINTVLDGNVATVKIDQRLDTNTAPSLEKEFTRLKDECDRIILDLSELEYTSSAGLRAMVLCHKLMKDKGGFEVKNPSDAVMEILKLTGLNGLLNIEK